MFLKVFLYSIFVVFLCFFFFFFFVFLFIYLFIYFFQKAKFVLLKNSNKGISASKS